jgi:hypothetical protein
MKELEINEDARLEVTERVLIEHLKKEDTVMVVKKSV